MTSGEPYTKIVATSADQMPATKTSITYPVGWLAFVTDQLLTIKRNMHCCNNTMHVHESGSIFVVATGRSI